MRYQTIKIKVCILKTCQVNIRSLTWRGKILAVTKSLSTTFTGPLTVMTARLDTQTIHRQISAARDPKIRQLSQWSCCLQPITSYIPWNYNGVAALLKTVRHEHLDTTSFHAR